MPEKEYIERGQAINVFKTFYGASLRVMLEALEEEHAADVRPVVHARPVKIFDNPWTGKMFTTCSACDGKIGPKDKFCKHCAADLRGGEQNGV